MYLLLAALICGLDQFFKLWVKASIDIGSTVTVIPHVLGLTQVHNTGMAFSMLSGFTWVLSIVSVAAAAAVCVLILRRNFTKGEKLALAMILGGALGNAVDRIFQGYVVDMFELLFVKFAVFNLADLFIDGGAVIFCVLYISRTLREERAKKREKQ